MTQQEGRRFQEVVWFLFPIAATISWILVHSSASRAFLKGAYNSGRYRLDVREHFVVSCLFCTTWLVSACSAQIPRRLEDCLPIPSLAQDIEMRREEARAKERQELPKPHIKVTELTFRGQVAVPPDQLGQIAQSLTEHRYEDDSEWPEELLARITDAWQHLGYLKAAVADPRVRQLDEGTPLEKRVAVSVAVDAGRVYRLDRMTFANGIQFSADELRASFPIQDGDVLDTHALQQGLENVRKAYGARGFINSLIMPSFDINEPYGLVKLSFNIDEGKQFRFGEVKVLGLNPDLAQDLLRRSGLKRENVFESTLLEKFFKDNAVLLPKDAISFDDTQRRINEEQATVDITMDFSGCPQLPDQ